MKLRILIGFLVVLGGLWWLNRRLNHNPQYMPEVKSTSASVEEQVRDRFMVGFLPVTCHLTCPVTNWVTEHSHAGTVFQSQRFGDFPTMKEALIARKIDATFMIAPLAMKLVADGVPVKIVYLGHRDGSALTVAKDSSAQRFEDLAGKRVAVPSRYSNQNLLMRRMMKQRGMDPQAIELVEMAPPDMASALAARSIEGYIVGEPHNAKAEIGGYGRILYFMKDLWPDFISCVLVVRQEIIEERRPLVQELVQGIADSGAWLDDPEDSLDHRKRAAEVVGKLFYNQDPKLLEHVLLQPDRVGYSRLVPPKDTFDEIMDLAVETKVIERRMRFEEYCDTSFASSLREPQDLVAFPPSSARAQKP